MKWLKAACMASVALCAASGGPAQADDMCARLRLNVSELRARALQLSEQSAQAGASIEGGVDREFAIDDAWVRAQAALSAARMTYQRVCTAPLAPATPQPTWLTPRPQPAAPPEE
ncbi:MAG: hypothetical protein AB7M12_03200 [Hyphomonadaceae bacterium]